MSVNDFGNGRRSKVEFALKNVFVDSVRDELIRRGMTTTKVSRQLNYKPRQTKAILERDYALLSLSMAMNFAERLGISDAAMSRYYKQKHIGQEKPTRFMPKLTDEYLESVR